MPRIRSWITTALLAAATTSTAPAQNGSGDANRLTVADFRADLATLRSGFMERDRSFAAPARAEAEKRIAALEAGLDTVSRVQFELEVARIVALADNGHTNAFAGGRARRYNRVALRFVPFGQDLYVVRAREAHRDLLGARLTGIDEKSAAELRSVAHSLMGGAPQHRDRFTPCFVESPEQMHALGVAVRSDAATYHLELSDGRRISRRIPAHPSDPAARVLPPSRLMYPEALEGKEWEGLLPPERAPWALRDPDSRFRWREATDIPAVVVEFRQNVGAPGHSIESFLAEVTAELQRRRPRHLVLDMRMNGGGDLTTTRVFMQQLPSLVSGRIFVLTSPWTFSAAISSTGYLKQAAPERVAIVGEAVGDRLEFFAEGRPITLPRSGIVIGLATERHDYATGCRPFNDCHRYMVRNPITVRTLAPEIPAPWTIAAYRAGRDPAMEAVARAIR